MIPRRNIVFAINAGLQFTPQFLPDAPLDAAYSQTLRAFGGRPLYRFFLLSGSLPTGLSLTDNGDGTATIDGTATEGGPFAFRLLLIDGERNEVTADFTINVQAAPLSLSGSISATEVGEAFTGGVTASGGIPPYTYSLTGSVPPGLSINASTGAAQGAATEDGDYSFFAVVSDSVAASANAPQSVEVDPQPFLNVVSLMSYDSSETLDQTGRSWGNNGCVLDNTNKKFGAGSLDCAGTGFLTTPISDDWDFGSGDFTIDMWVRWEGSGIGNRFEALICHDNIGITRGWLMFLGDNSSGRGYPQFAAYVGGASYSVAATSAMTVNSWQHLAVVRDGNTLRLYRDGVQQDSTAIAGSINDPEVIAYISVLRQSSGIVFSSQFNGQIDELRVIKGQCAFPNGTTFTPPTSAYTYP